MANETNTLGASVAAGEMGRESGSHALPIPQVSPAPLVLVGREEAGKCFQVAFCRLPADVHALALFRELALLRKQDEPIIISLSA